MRKKNSEQVLVLRPFVRDLLIFSCYRGGEDISNFVHAQFRKAMKNALVSRNIAAIVAHLHKGRESDPILLILLCSSV